MVGPWISFFSLEVKKGRDMGDIEYLCTQQRNGNITRLEGAINAVTNKLTHTIAANKDGYILVAKIFPSGFTVPATSLVGNTLVRSDNHSIAKISVATVEIDRVAVGMATATRSTQQSGTSSSGGNGSNYGDSHPTEFKAAIGMKGTTGQVIEIENILDNGSCRAQLVILEVNTGATPQLPSI